MNPSGLDNSSLQFIIEKFNEKIIKNGHNQLNWISMERGKMGYMTRETRNSYSTNTSALQWWSSENSMMILWLVNIMLLMIGKTYLFLSMTREVWEDVREIYLMKKTFLKIFELKTWLWQTKQGIEKWSNTSWRWWLTCKKLIYVCFEEEWEYFGDSVCCQKKKEK